MTFLEKINEKNGIKVLYILLFIFAAEIVLFAWVCDDAYITLRTVDNFVNGYGLRWNIIERVQSYTHPLWMFILSGAYFVTREPFYTTIFVSLAVSVVAVWVFIFKVVCDKQAAAIGTGLLILSKAFVDYTTSGLENPMTYLLCALFFWMYLRNDIVPERKTFFLSFIFALAAVNRMDTVLLLFPALAFEFYQRPDRKNLLFAAAGAMPFVFWEAFSLLYYGFPFPNTAYAKLPDNIGGFATMWKGLQYLNYSLERDLLTVVVIAAGVILPLVKKDKRFVPLSIGVFLYVVYVIKVGGDFMGGRFLTAPFFCSAMIIARFIIGMPLRVKSMVFLLALMIGAWSHVIGNWPLILSPGKPTLKMIFDEKNRIADERRFYSSSFGLFTYNNNNAQQFKWISVAKEAREKKYRLIFAENMGFFGYYAGQGVYLVDLYALTDPLLARLPVNTKSGHFRHRIGHFGRKVPDGYRETILEGKNKLQDKNLALYYDKLCIVTRGDIFDLERIREIWRFNTRQYRHLIDKKYYSETPNVEILEMFHYVIVP